MTGVHKLGLQSFSTVTGTISVFYPRKREDQFLEVSLLIKKRWKENIHTNWRRCVIFIIEILL